MRAATTVLLLLLTAFVAVAAIAAVSDPSKPVWPTSFIAPFGLNSVIPNFKNATSQMVYRYDSQIQAQRIDYLQHCLPLVHWDAAPYPCQLWFLNSGIYVHQPKTGLNCCLFQPDVGAVPPDFLRPFNFSHTEPASDYYGVGHQCNYWTGPEGFGYWTDQSTGFDVEFKDGPTGVTWSFGEFNVKTVDVSEFDLPLPLAQCSGKCGFLSEKNFNLEHHTVDPMVRLAFEAKKHADAIKLVDQQ